MITKLSHQHMSTFFSGTDNDEIYDNSEVHNYYLSLIVNNKNEMCARVAFREFLETTGKSVVKYRDTEGTFKTKTVPYKDSSFVVKYYECDIIKPNIEEIDLLARIKELKLTKQQAIVQNYQSYNSSSNFKQYPLGLPSLIQKDNTSLPTRQLDVFDNNIVSRDRVISMLTSWLNQDYLSVKPLNQSIASIHVLNPDELDFSLNLLEDSLRTYYINSFPEDINQDKLLETMNIAVDIIKVYTTLYESTVNNLIDIIEYIHLMKELE